MRGMLSKTEIGLFVALAVLLLAKLILPEWAVTLGTVALARGLVVLGLLILWRTGLISFGQALFFGTGGYTVGLLRVYGGLTDIFVLTLLAFLFAGLLAYLLGLLISRYREIFFAMLCLAFSMMLYGVLVKTEVLGSTDGFNVVGLTLFGFPIEGNTLQTVNYFWMCLLACAMSILVHRYLSSTMGHLSPAIRDNEIRVEYLGVSVQRTINVKFVIAGALAGGGGAITAIAVGHVDPDAMVYWLISGEFVFVTIFAGTGSVAAPFLGSVIFELLRTYAFEYMPLLWQLTMGTVLLIVIVFLPNGLWSLVQRGPRKG
ncbi:MAG: branched-chain amino acid ABC transporter permease [SAR324 cluster bacterium]|nr:branched-chain amino acid ABC transporter permease [SAR324 cluster bacterium]